MEAFILPSTAYVQNGPPWSITALQAESLTEGQSVGIGAESDGEQRCLLLEIQI